MEVARKVGKNWEVARKVAHLLGRFMDVEILVSQFPIFVIAGSGGSLGFRRTGKSSGSSLDQLRRGNARQNDYSEGTLSL